MNTKSIIGRIPKGKRQSIFSRGSRACQHAMSPLCQPTLDGSVAKRCCTNLIHTLRHHKNLPTSEVAQWHEQCTRVAFGAPAGKAQDPPQATNRVQRQSTTPLNDPPITSPNHPTSATRWCNSMQCTRGSPISQMMKSSVQVSGLCLLSSQRVCTSVWSAKRVAKASHTLYL